MKYPGSLHSHTDWSNLKVRDSINKVDDMINLAIELGHSCIAFTEHEILSGAIAIEKSYDKIKKTYGKKEEFPRQRTRKEGKKDIPAGCRKGTDDP